MLACWPGYCLWIRISKEHKPSWFQFENMVVQILFKYMNTSTLFRNHTSPRWRGKSIFKSLTYDQYPFKVHDCFSKLAFAAGFATCSGNVKLGQTVTGENIVVSDGTLTSQRLIENRFCFTPPKPGRQGYQATSVSSNLKLYAQPPWSDGWAISYAQRPVFTFSPHGQPPFHLPIGTDLTLVPMPVTNREGGTKRCNELCSAFTQVTRLSNNCFAFF